MKHVFCIVSFLLLMVTGQAYAYESFTMQVDLYSGVDLASGMEISDPTVLSIVVGDPTDIEVLRAPEATPLFGYPSPVNFSFGFSTLADTPIALLADNVIGVALLQGTACDSVDTLTGLDILPAPATVALGSQDSVVLQLADDSYVLLGNLQQDGVTLRFQYRQVDVGSGTPPGTVPEASTLLLLGVGLAGICGAAARRGKTLLLIALLLTALAGTAHAAATLTVTLEGTGEGTVIGDGIRCGDIRDGDDCTETYDEHTALHLKAYAHARSTFVEWRVNGDVQEGPLVITEDMTVTAVFDKNYPPELEVYWYDFRGSKIVDDMELDEVAIFFEDNAQWAEFSEDELAGQLQDIFQLFHPEAFRFFGGGPPLGDVIFIRSPEPMADRNQLFEKFALLTAHPLVKRVSPVFDDSSSKWPKALLNELHITFPDTASEEYIQSIEEEYHLIRFASYTDLGILSFDYTLDLQTNDPLEILHVANTLYESGLVEGATPHVFGNFLELDSLPNDEYFEEQWNLYNTANNSGTPGEDINVVPAWEMGFKGSPEEVIAIVEYDGVELTHEDLKPNVQDADLDPDAVPQDQISYDFVEGDHDPLANDPPVDDETYWESVGEKYLHDWTAEKARLYAAHGTQVAGVAAASGYNWLTRRGISGVAPSARLAAFRTPLGHETWGFIHSFIEKSHFIDIYNYSVGIPSLKKLKDGNYRAIQNGSQLGNIYVTSSGNRASREEALERVQSTHRALNNDRRLIVVGASGFDGPYAPYSEAGANVLVNATSTPTIDEECVRTTSANNTYTKEDAPGATLDTICFGGTSAAAPAVSGAIALMLQANPELDGRDVRQILIDTAEKNPGWDGQSNDAGYSHSYALGFGRVDAEAAVTEALRWKAEDYSLPDEQDTGWMPEQEGGTQATTIHVPYNLRIEFVDVEFTSPVPYNRLQVTLASPHTTESILTRTFGTSNSARTFQQWRFGSVRHIGESSEGDWTLRASGGAIGGWRLRIYGTELPAPSYVKTVQVTSGGQPIYHAGWEPLEDEQLGFVYFTDPIAPTAGAITKIQVFANEAMQAMSVELPGQIKKALDPCADPQNGTCWTGELTLPELDEYPLTIRGRDVAGNYVLPFADREPKTLSEWVAADIDTGDTVHQLGDTMPFTWQLVTPTASTCHESESGIRCNFEDDSGSVLLRPTDADQSDRQYLVLDEQDETGTTHSGSYSRAANSIEVVPLDWQVTDTTTSSSNCDEEPAPPDDIEWSIASDMQEQQATVTLTIGERDVEAVFDSSPASPWIVTPNQASGRISAGNWTVVNTESTGQTGQEAWVVTETGTSVSRSSCGQNNERMYTGNNVDVLCPANSSFPGPRSFPEQITVPLDQQNPPTLTPQEPPDPPNDPPFGGIGGRTLSWISHIEQVEVRETVWPDCAVHTATCRNLQLLGYGTKPTYAHTCYGASYGRQRSRLFLCDSTLTVKVYEWKSDGETTECLTTWQLTGEATVSATLTRQE